jgi:hypothetical protein
MPFSSKPVDENGDLLPGYVMMPNGQYINTAMYGGRAPVWGKTSRGEEGWVTAPLAANEYFTSQPTANGKGSIQVINTLPKAPASVIAAGASPTFSTGDGNGSLTGYTKSNPDGSITAYSLDGTVEWTRFPSIGGGGMFGGMFSGISDAISGLGKEVAGSPIGQALISGGLAAVTGGASIPWTSAALGANQVSQTGGNVGAGLLSGLASYGVGSGVAGLAGGSAAGLAGQPVIDASGNMIGGELASGVATSSPVTGGLAGGWAPIASGAAAIGGAANTASTAAGSTASTAAATAGAGKMINTGNATLDAILNGAKDYAPLIGAVGGALAQGDTKTSTTADKSPWAPAQDWMKSNIARGQALQKQYADSPFNALQKQAYNNQAGLGNQFRGMVNGMVPQMNQFKPYQRTPQSQVVSPYNFGTSNLGMTTNPFPGA